MSASAVPILGLCSNLGFTSIKYVVRWILTFRNASKLTLFLSLLHSIHEVW